MTPFAELIQKCGLSLRGAAGLLDVRYDTVRNWYYDKAKTPEPVLEQLRAYAEAARKIFKSS